MTAKKKSPNPRTANGTLKANPKSIVKTKAKTHGKTNGKTNGKPNGTSKAAAPGAVQSATERRLAEAESHRLIAAFAPSHARLVAGMREVLRKRLPTAHELVYEYRSWFVISFSPTEAGHEGVLGIRGDADGIRLYFTHGQDLPDPGKLLKGSAQVRYIDVMDAAELRQPAVMSLMEASIARSPVPFGSAGRGSIIIRSAKAPAKKSPARSASKKAGKKTAAKTAPTKASAKGPSVKLKR